MKQVQKRKTPGPYHQMWREWCHELDIHILTPIQQGGIPDTTEMQRLFSRFGTWDTLKSEMDTCLDDEDYYKVKYEDLKWDVECMRDDIQEVKELLEDITEIGDSSDTDEEGNYIVSKGVLDDANKDIDKAVTMLGKIEDKCDI